MGLSTERNCTINGILLESRAITKTEDYVSVILYRAKYRCKPV